MQTAETLLPALARPVLVRSPERGTDVHLAVVALHGAAQPQRDQPLFEHLARTLAPLGVAVVSYDRRADLHGGDVPLDDQASDALAALEWVRDRMDVPVGLFGFSQGAWAACVAAADEPVVSCLALVGCSGVSPAAQMRFLTDQQLRRSGFAAEDRAELATLRLAVEDVLRGAGDRDRAATLLARATSRPWFPQAYLPPELPPPDVRWDDLDWDPAPVVARVTARTVLIHGADDEAVPLDGSQAVWRDHGERDLTVVTLTGCGHLPVVGSAASVPEPLEVGAFSVEYTDALRSFFSSGLASAGAH